MCANVLRVCVRLLGYLRRFPVCPVFFCILDRSAFLIDRSFRSLLMLEENVCHAQLTGKAHGAIQARGRFL